MSEQKNLILAMALALLVFLGWNYLFPPQKPAQKPSQTAEQQAAGGNLPQLPSGDLPKGPADNAALPQTLSRETALAQSPRVIVDTPRLKGSLALKGGRFDDLILKDYWETVEREAQITLLSPADTLNAYFVEFGWVAPAGVAVPDRDTLWVADKRTLTPDAPVTLSYESPDGLLFKRVISVDKDYMFTISQTVENTGAKAVSMAPYGLIGHRGMPHDKGRVTMHIGPLGVLDGTLKEVDYDDLKDGDRVQLNSTGGWVGITDKYWLTTLIPDQDRPFQARFFYAGAQKDQYQADFREDPMTIAPGGSAMVENRFFAGAKEVNLIDRYEDQYNIKMFDRTIDWGWLYPLTRPIFWVLDHAYKLLGNFGLAIIALTFLVRLALFPLANKQFVSMSRMKKVQPKMKELQERYKDDKMRLQQEMMALYKREKVNPLSGCLPIIVQMPVFFALYKVLLVTIEMRHAPFFGWVHDLSAPDPLTPVNLFGLLPFDPPAFIAIGIWPLVMGVSMWFQQHLNPAPADPTQAKIFKLMPFIFTFILAPFAVGLVLYWTSNNILTILQQWIIMRKVEKES